MYWAVVTVCFFIYLPTFRLSKTIFKAKNKTKLALNIKSQFNVINVQLVKSFLYHSTVNIHAHVDAKVENYVVKVETK